MSSDAFEHSESFRYVDVFLLSLSGHRGIAVDVVRYFSLFVPVLALGRGGDGIFQHWFVVFSWSMDDDRFDFTSKSSDVYEVMLEQPYLRGRFPLLTADFEPHRVSSRFR